MVRGTVVRGTGDAGGWCQTQGGSALGTGGTGWVVQIEREREQERECECGVGSRGNVDE